MCSFHDDWYGPAHTRCRPRRGCGPAMHYGSQSYGPPPWLFSHGGQPHHHRTRMSPFLLAPVIAGAAAGIWKLISAMMRDTESRQSESRKRSVWENETECKGFSPNEVKLEMSCGKVFLTCSQEQSDRKGNSQVRQMKRTIILPREVDGDKVTATFDSTGVLRLTAPFRKADQGEKSEGTLQHIPIETTEEMTEYRGSWTNWTAQADGASEDCMEINNGQTAGPLMKQMEIQKSDNSNAKNMLENNPFKIKIDMESFDSDSIEVKLKENTLTITGNREQRDEAAGASLACKTMFRRLTLPENVNTDLLKSTLNQQGQLMISAPYKTEKHSEKVIPIVFG